MADRLTASIEGVPELRKRLAKMNPAQNAKITQPALIEMMLHALRTAATRYIYPGGGGPPKSGILTSRTGTLRRSLAGDFSLDRSGLSRNFVEGGTRLIYGAVHEFGNATHRTRPFLKPGLADASSSFDDIFLKHWRRAGEVA